MKPALGYNSVSPINDWASIPLGEQVREAEQAIISEQLKYCFGQYLLKIGQLSNVLESHESTIPTQVNLTTLNNKTPLTGVVAEFDELPFLENSIDAIVMNHVLEFGSDPHQILREAHRVLLPNGNLILAVFNPWSSLALQKLVPSQKFQLFKKGRFFSVARVKDWLHLLGFEVTKEDYLCYSVLAQNDQELDSSFVPSLLKRFCPSLGGVCILVAKKREWPLTPVRPRVRYRTMFNPAVRSSSLNRTTRHATKQ